MTSGNLIARLLLCAGVCATAALSAQSLSNAPGLASITANGLRGDVFFLAADEMAGRDSLSREGRIAANYIAAEFMRLGLKPIGAGTYFQNFPMTSAVLDREHTSLTARWTSAGAAREKTCCRLAGTRNWEPLRERVRCSCAGLGAHRVWSFHGIVRRLSG
jgi:hypothetical protein